MQVPLPVIVALEFIGMALAGFVVGKTVHILLRQAISKIAKRTETKLDDFILEELDGPLVAISAFFVVYEISNHLTNLAGFRETISRYSLSIIVFLAAYSVAEILGAVLRWYYVEGREKRHLKDIKVDVSLLPFLRKLSKIAILFAGTVLSLSLLGINVTGFFAIASVIGVIIGLASQETLANIFAGLALQLDRPFLYGEYLKFTTGEVARLVKIGLRSTRLEDLNGNVIIISNSELAKQRVTNLSRPTDEYGSAISIDLPRETDLYSLEEFIDNSIASANIEGLKPEKVHFLVEKVSKDSVTVSIGFGVSAHPHLSKARDYINRKVVDFLKKSQK